MGCNGDGCDFGVGSISNGDGCDFGVGSVNVSVGCGLDIFFG